jgi:hypothetical protein|nr:MAG TPA: hypothetical protein [Caudoviricetes sp.]
MTTKSKRLLYLVLSSVLFGVAIGVIGMLAYTRTKVHQVEEQYRNAYYLSMDETGLWLGERPGHKFYPMYDMHGNRLGAKRDSTTGTE